MSDGYMSRHRDITTYRYFFAQEWKKPLNLPVERHLEWPNAYICLKLISSHGNLNFSPEFSDGDMYNHAWAVHVTTRLILPELTRLKTFVWKIRWWNRVRHDSLGVKTSNASPIFCGSLLILLFFLKKCQMVICPVTGTYNHV